MSVTVGLVLNEHNAHSRRAPDPRVGFVLLERTLLDPPRASATKRWAEQIRRRYPEAKLLPYAWHLLTHGPEERMQERTTRTLSGEPHRFGGLQDNPQTRQAWEVTRLCAEAVDARAIVVRTPPGVTPGALGRTRLRAFVEARRAEGIQVIWEPEGLWEPPIAAALAQQLGATLMLPAFAGGRPLRNEAGEGLAVPGAWLRVDGSGPRLAIHGDVVDELLDHCDAVPNTVMIFSGPRAHGNLGAFAEAFGA